MNNLVENQIKEYILGRPIKTRKTLSEAFNIRCEKISLKELAEINQFKKFVLLSLAGLILSNLIIILNSQFFSFSAFTAILSITLVIPLINFFVLKYWVFET